MVGFGVDDVVVIAAVVVADADTMPILLSMILPRCPALAVVGGGFDARKDRLCE